MWTHKPWIAPSQLSVKSPFPIPSPPSLGIVPRVSICPSAVMNAKLCYCWAAPLFTSPSAVQASNCRILEVEAETVTQKKVSSSRLCLTKGKLLYSSQAPYTGGPSIPTPGTPQVPDRAAQKRNMWLMGSLTSAGRS